MNQVQQELRFWMDGQMVEINFASERRWSPTTTVLQYLRSLQDRKGTKEGCAEGDCGACTVVLGEPTKDGGLKYRAIDSCLVFLPMLHGKQLLTIESIGRSDNLHPVQAAMVNCDGSQCGYCTPGFVMSLFALYKAPRPTDTEEVMDALTGNLCRCTGYRPIVEAAAMSCTGNNTDQFSQHESLVAAQLRIIASEATSLSLANDTCRYLRPGALSEALSYRKSNPEALVVCGATDVGLMVTKRKLTLPLLLDLSGVPELKDVHPIEGGVRLGATLDLEQVRRISKSRWPALYDMLSVFGSRQIREQGTLGGNVANASPIGDTPPVLWALDARVEVQSLQDKREIPLSSFITGYRTTDLRSDELITAIVIPDTPVDRMVRAYKVSKRKDLDISTVSGGFWLVLDAGGYVADIGLVYGGMAAMTKRATKAEQFLLGKAWTRLTIDAALPLIDAEFTPISDARSGKEGRRLMARNLLLKFWSDTNTANH